MIDNARLGGALSVGWSSENTWVCRDHRGHSRGMLRPEFRGPDKAYGVEVPVPDDAPAYDRLAGWFGRNPGWTPGVS